MCKFIGMTICFVLLTIAPAFGENVDSDNSVGVRDVPEITLASGAAGIALLTGGSLVLADKLRRRN